MKHFALMLSILGMSLVSTASERVVVACTDEDGFTERFMATDLSFETDPISQEVVRTVQVEGDGRQTETILLDPSCKVEPVIRRDRLSSDF